MSGRVRQQGPKPNSEWLANQPGGSSTEPGRPCSQRTIEAVGVAEQVGAGGLQRISVKVCATRAARRVVAAGADGRQRTDGEGRPAAQGGHRMGRRQLSGRAAGSSCPGGKLGRRLGGLAPLRLPGAADPRCGQRRTRAARCRGSRRRRSCSRRWGASPLRRRGEQGTGCWRADRLGLTEHGAGAPGSGGTPALLLLPGGAAARRQALPWRLLPPKGAGRGKLAAAAGARQAAAASWPARTPAPRPTC